MKLKVNRQDKLFYALFMATILFNIWKIFYGICSRDESFYISIVSRMVNGERPIVDIWNPGQFSAMALIPLYKLFLTINGSQEGVIVFFRACFVGMNAFLGIFLYKHLKQYGMMSILTILILNLYCMSQEMTTDYNTIGLASMLVASVLLIWNKDSNKWNAYIAGIFYALAVLCTPHNALLYFGFSLCFLFVRNDVCLGKLRKQWLPFTLGCVSLALVILGYIFSKISVNQFLEFFPLLFQTDTRNGSGAHAILWNFLALCKMVWLNSKITMVIVPSYFLMVVYCLFEKKRKEHRSLYIKIMVVFTVLLIVGYHKGVNDYAMISFLPMGIMLMLLDEGMDGRLRQLWFAGLLYMLMINMSSNTIINASSHASSVCMIASLLMCDSYLKRNEELHINWMVYTLACFMICNVSYDKLTVTFLDDSPLHMQDTLNIGCGKHLVTTNEKKVFYDQQIENLNSVVNTYDGPILIYSDVTWMSFSLDTKHKNAIYSVWYNIGDEQADDRLISYYGLLPENMPVAIYVPSSNLTKETYLIEKLSGYEKVHTFTDGSIVYAVDKEVLK